MKYFIITTIMLISMVSQAELTCDVQVSNEEVSDTLEIKTDVPKFLEGATIIVRLKDGTETSVPAEKFKVVARKQQFVTTATTKSVVHMCNDNSSSKNRVSVHAGKGPKGGLNRSNDGKSVTVESQYGEVGGLQYQYKFDNDLSLSGQVQTNQTGLIGVGYDF